MPKDIDPHSTIKQNNRWAVKGSGNAKAGIVRSKQEQVLEKAREIARKKKSKND